jgi:predicted TIM-barrel fold metal-dependent hydrolase
MTTTSTVPTAVTTGKISADAHVNEPRTLWSENLPEAMREHAMRGIEAGDDGGWSLILDGRHVAKAGEDESHRLKMLDPAHRHEIMRHEGVVGECVFPTIGLYVWMLEDQAGCEASCRVYNEFVADGLARSPRFKCAGLVPTWTVEGALAELDRIAGAGLGAFMLPTVSRPGPAWNHPQWEPLWSAIEEAGLPVVMHQGTGHSMQYHRGAGAAVASLLATQSEGPRTAALLATSGVLAAHPDLHVVFVEYNAAWLGWMMQTIDFYTTSFARYGNTTPSGKPWTWPDLPEPPSHYVRHQVHATFQDDPVALHNLPFTGTDAVLWGNDYPHEEGTYPHSQEIVERLATELDPATARRVFRDNALEIFHFDEQLLDEPLPDATASS